MPDYTPEQHAIIQRMVDAGESEDNIATVIHHFDAAPAADAHAALDARMQTGPIQNTGIGMVKGAARTAIGLGEMVAPVLRHIPLVKNYVATPAQFDEAKRVVAPNTTAQKVGEGIEHGLEYMAPAGAVKGAIAKVAPRAVGLLSSMGAEAVSAAGVAKAHGDNVKTAAGLSAAIPVAGAVAEAAVPALKSGAVRLARAALKPTVTEMKQTAGASRIGIDTLADRMASFIVKNRLTTPAKAQAIIDAAESEIQMMVGPQPTDAATRAARYLKALENSAVKQGLNAGDVSQIRAAGAELADGPMGRDVVTSTTNMVPSKILNAQGQPAAMLPVVSRTTTRGLRPTVPADEALTSARSSSRWATNKQWGEQKGTVTEASKAVERAQRDAVKAAVPESKPVFNVYSQAIKARDVLARKAFREGNRDMLGLATQGIAAGEMMKGRTPIIAAAANYLRGNQLKLGIWADKLANAIKSNDVQAITEIMARQGVSLAADGTATDPLERELMMRASH